MSHRTVTPALRRAFQKKIYGYFRRHRRAFPWRETRDPYPILVSEVMLQQTQTARVATKFVEFVAAFPDFETLARAPLGEVLRVWQGMGYNRRALYLQRAAQEVVGRHGGKLPRSVEELERLPGIGPATARSIAAYAYNEPVVFIETNVRAVFIHEFFKDRQGVSDDELRPIVEQTLHRKDPWKWYNALMDYGVMLKEKHANPARRSRHYVRQSPWATSDRRIRGEIVRAVNEQGPRSESELRRVSSFPGARVRACLAGLVRDGLLVRERGKYRFPG